MDNTTLRTLIDTAKGTLSCVEYLNQHGILVRRSGECICTPSQIRSDHHPSFGVWHSGCKDFSTGDWYDIFALDMAITGHTFAQSLKDLAGISLTSDEAATVTSSVKSTRAELFSNIQEWHLLLLKNPVIWREAQQREEGALDYLLSRGLTLSYIKKEQLGYDPAHKRIIFPFKRDAYGRPEYYAGRDFSGRAELDKSHHLYISGKYWKAPVTLGRDNFPWGLQTLRHPPSVRVKGATFHDDYIDSANPKESTIIICEGAVDAALFAQHGWQVLSPFGGDFRASQLKLVLDICRCMRQVFICFDNDAAGCAFQGKWMRRLFEARIPFICGHTAPYGAAKFDIADYYKAAIEAAQSGESYEAGEEALLGLVREATPGIVELSKTIHSLDKLAEFLEQSARFSSPLSLLKLRKSLLARTVKVKLPDGSEGSEPEFKRDEVKYLFTESVKFPPEYVIAEEVKERHNVVWGLDDQFYEFNGHWWEPRHKVYIQQYIYEALGRKASVSKVKRVYEAMQIFYPAPSLFNEQHVFTFGNGTLKLDEDDEAGHKGKLVPSRPEFMATLHAPYSYDPEARCLTWERVLYETFGGNFRLIREFQKAAGSVLEADNRTQKLYYLIGDGANGKSTLLTILNEVYGEENCTNLRPDRLASEFDPILLRNSIANFCNEARGYLGGAEESLKSAVSGDKIGAAHKGQDAMFFRPRAKWFIAANNRFNARDISEGFLRRFVFFPFKRRFAPGDKDLIDKLRSEIPGIFNWCLMGYRNLQSEGFIECVEQHDERVRFEEHIEPLRVFVRETFTQDFSEGSPLGSDFLYTRYPSMREVYAKYKDWSAESGFSYTNRAIFTERMTYLLPRLERASGLSNAYVETQGGQEYIILHELDEVIRNAYELGNVPSWQNVIASAGDKDEAASVLPPATSSDKQGDIVSKLGEWLPLRDASLRSIIERVVDGGDKVESLKRETLKNKDSRRFIKEKQRNYFLSDDDGVALYLGFKQPGSLFNLPITIGLKLMDVLSRLPDLRKLITNFKEQAISFMFRVEGIVDGLRQRGVIGSEYALGM